ncbi:gamma carbonic anhydrase family protein [Sphingomonas gilva]|uniref:Gamma carbonic anhydrase family protein n=1 Tax=Sphingomonas gilva TaxID=2305907 RepID=A0A396RVX6_9SPHN|nr:gamma carbonic anhydrase family protein [Sphingomonas gilva]RHW17831.1 gamma carbonic anhydrase family protein [Sphingomonas gilva]
MPLYEIAGKRPQLGFDAWVAPSADLIGEVVLGHEASVWFGACIRADNTVISVGNRSNIQEGAMLHSDYGVPCTVGADVTVGHHAMLHGCTIEDEALIGMKATVLNNAVIPTGCIVGAGALVTEGKRFEPNSLIVGAPAKAIRTLDEAQRAILKASAAHYVAKAKQFSAELRRLD